MLEAHLRQIERVNPKVNAIVTLVAEAARAEADRADARLRRGEPVGPLHGLPIAIKDLVDTKGIRTTYGSRIYQDHVPERDELLVERVRAAGAVVLGKTNTPEFGAGSQTFNEVFGETRNPWDLTKTCGGSSGGGAVALACGMVPIADGSDMGGSLRNPPSFCSVFGLRPSPGRVPDWPSSLPWQTLSVPGPMGRIGRGRGAPALGPGRPGPARAHRPRLSGRHLPPPPAAAASRERASPGAATSAATRSSRG